MKIKRIIDATPDRVEWMVFAMHQWRYMRWRTGIGGDAVMGYGLLVIPEVWNGAEDQSS